MKLLLIGGGSGGHLFPLFCVADALVRHHQYSVSDLHFIIADNNADAEYFAEKPYSYTAFPVAKLRRYFSLENIRDGFRFFKNIWKAYFFLRKTRPQKIFSKGGFVSLPFGLAAKLLKIPFYLHETDSVMGLSNTVLERFATKVFTGFPSQNPQHLFVGNPVRPEFFTEIQETPHHIPHILVFGGSQGSEALNVWTRVFCKKILGKAEILLVTGKGKKSSESIPHLQEVEFLHQEFIDAVQNADMVIARAGGSIAELAAAKKCVVLVPLPSAANNHQKKNAELVLSKNAGMVIEEKNLYAEQSFQAIIHCLENSERRKLFGENLSAFASPSSVQNIISYLL